MDWLFAVEGEGENGYSKFYEAIDTILIGRVAYNWIIEHENGSIPYKGKKCYVFSKTKKEDNEHVNFIYGDIVQFSIDLKNKNGRNIWLVGAENYSALSSKKN